MLAMNPSITDFFDHPLEKSRLDHFSLSERIGESTDAAILSVHSGEPKTDNSDNEGNHIQTRNPSNALPTIDDFPVAYTIENLPWYAIVLGAQDSITAGLKESRTYRNIRKRHLPLEILYFKLLQTFQRPEYIKEHQVVPTHVDQLLFVVKVDEGIFRPIHRKSEVGADVDAKIGADVGAPVQADVDAKVGADVGALVHADVGAQNHATPREHRDSLVTADIKLCGDRRNLSIEEKKEHLEITIELKRRALDSMKAKLPYRQFVASTLNVIKHVINEDMDDEDIKKYNAQIKDMWERFFPTPKKEPTPKKNTSKKRKSLKAAHDNEVNKDCSNHDNDLHDNESKKRKTAKDTA